VAAPILLIGATGQIGWELRRVLAPLAPIEAPGRKLLDLSDEAQVRRQVRAIRPALIVNAAAHTAVDKAEEEEQAAMTVNGLAPGWLCILGEDPFGAAMESIEGMSIKQRPLVVIRIAQVSDAEACQILFISTSEEERLRAILHYLHEQPILTVADIPNFARVGGIIGLKTVEDRIRFNINVDAANAADLKFSSKLLRLGNIVSGDAI